MASATVEIVAACVGTKELVASTPQYLKLRTPERDTVLHPAVHDLLVEALQSGRPR